RRANMASSTANGPTRSTSDCGHSAPGCGRRPATRSTAGEDGCERRASVSTMSEEQESHRYRKRRRRRHHDGDHRSRALRDEEEGGEEPSTSDPRRSEQRILIVVLAIGVLVVWYLLEFLNTR